MSARKLRFVLFGALLLLIALNGVGYSFLSKYLSQKSSESDHAKIDAEVARTNSQRLQNLEKQLANSQDAVHKARQIVGTSADYQYQDQFINDINKLAKTYGIKVTSYTFPDATKPAAPVAAVGVKKKLPKGVKQILVTVNINGAVEYDSYLKFLRSIELNLTRLQITGVNVSPDPVNPKLVTNPSIGIEMYVRQ